MNRRNDKHLIDIHIPADADMEISNLRKSYLEALVFFIKYYPDLSGADMVCKPYLRNNCKIEWTTGRLVSDPFCEI